MENADPTRADQIAPATDTPPRGRRLSGFGLVAVWAGRALVVATVAAVVASRLTRPTWAAEGWDSNGQPRYWLPNLAFVLVLVAGLLGQWLCGLAVSPGAAWREGDELVAATLVWRRRIRVPGALVVRFRAPGKGGTVHGAFVIGRGLRVLVLLSPFAVGGRSTIDRLVGRRVPETRGRAAVDYLVGFLWLLLTVAAVFVLLGLTVLWIGMFPS